MKRGNWNRKKERTFLPRLRFRPEATAVGLDDALANGETRFRAPCLVERVTAAAPVGVGRLDLTDGT